MGGIALHQGKIAEMRTGEGKTLTATLPVYLNALSGNGVHVVTVNDYLAQRDAQWMGRLYNFLGLSVGINLPQMSREDKQAAYRSDITYGTNNEYGFDYLRDNMVYEPADRVQRVLSYAIVDEVDSILIDEARTPLIISGQAEDQTQMYLAINQVAPRLKRQIGELDPRTGVSKDILMPNPLTALHDLEIDKDGIIWVPENEGVPKTEPKLWKFDPKTEKFKHKLEEQGKIKALAVTSAKRNPALPNTPTVVETGVANLEVVGFYGILAPKGTPPEVTNQLSHAFKEALEAPDIQKKMIDQGADPAYLNSDQFSKYLATEMPKWAKAVKQAGAKLD